MSNFLIDGDFTGSASRSSIPDVVTSAVAPLWASREAAERVGEPETSYSGYLSWVRTVVESGESLAGKVDSMAVCGEALRVLEQDDDLVLVELMSQPNGDGGYVGFMDARHLGVDARTRATHVVLPRGVSREPGGEQVLPAGATVEVLRDLDDEYVEACLPDGTKVDCEARVLRPLSAGPCDDLVELARWFIGSPYVWGGIEAGGIDCSGLVHVVCRIAGRPVPRDAHHQWAVTRVDVSWPSLRAGDLLFFGDRADLDSIDHVGFYAGDMRMLHAPTEGRPVVVERLSAQSQARTVAFGRVR